MFQLQRSSLFFEQMDAEYPTIVPNIEIVLENKNALDTAFHSPKHFILHLNNLLRSLLFFIEFSKKNPPAAWFQQAVKSFLEINNDDYQKLHWLRNASAHQKLIIPEESLVEGLFRIQSPYEYKLKLGLGDHSKPGKYARDIALKDTSDIFHDMLVFSSIAFMDLEHCAFGECLGITRRWYFKLPAKLNKAQSEEVTDVYELASSFSAALLDHICNTYAGIRKIRNDQKFSFRLAEHNFINTLLEIDMYPSLFSEWWEEECSPLNLGVRHEYALGRRQFETDHFHRWTYENLTDTPAAYTEQLIWFSSNTPDEIFCEKNERTFFSFILTNHWHFKSAFPLDPLESPVQPTDIMHLQRLGGTLMGEYRKKKLCTIDQSKSHLNAHIERILKLIGSGQTK